jgi:hypothetical protein
MASSSDDSSYDRWHYEQEQSYSKRHQQLIRSVVWKARVKWISGHAVAASRVCVVAARELRSCCMGRQFSVANAQSLLVFATWHSRSTDTWVWPGYFLLECYKIFTSYSYRHGTCFAHIGFQG